MSYLHILKVGMYRHSGKNHVKSRLYGHTAEKILGGGIAIILAYSINKSYQSADI